MPRVLYRSVQHCSFVPLRAVWSGPARPADQESGQGLVPRGSTWQEGSFSFFFYLYLLLDPGVGDACW